MINLCVSTVVKPRHTLTVYENGILLQVIPIIRPNIEFSVKEGNDIKLEIKHDTNLVAEHEFKAEGELKKGPITVSFI